MQILNQLMSDPNLQKRVGKLISGKFKVDMLSLKAGAELSRRLLEMPSTARVHDAADGARLRKLVEEHLDYYEGLVGLSMTFNRKLLDGFAAPEEKKPESKPPPTLALTAPLLSTLRAPFDIENNKTAPASLTFEISPFASEDGSRLIASHVVFEPAQIDLAPGQKSRVQMVMTPGEEFTPGTAYFATIKAVGFESSRIAVKLAVTQPSQPSPAAEPAKAQAKSKRKTAKPRRGARK